ncbi:MAG: PD40 domain-containing protein [Armatimonadetes bacterium]|nr:PD40 domain-containing protein [Armatimonadota bacterium]
MAFSPRGELLATAGVVELNVWDLRTMKRVHSTKLPGTVFGGVAFSPDGRTLACLGSPGVQLYDARTGAFQLALRGEAASVAFSPDGRMLATGEGRFVPPKLCAALLWDAHTGALLRRLPRQSGPVRSVAFSPDGRTLATAGDDNLVRVWDLRQPGFGYGAAQRLMELYWLNWVSASFDPH